MCPRLSANYVSCCPPNMAQVSVWAGNLQGRIHPYSFFCHSNKSFTWIVWTMFWRGSYGGVR